ncbi:hypothetical protein ANCCAN_03323 [Ancylostoma caninum]|uniref:Uncharacterized protein n=1 Tax=Ancylostoma caninum TaxID=29170 RepID=A0A368H5X0_ANCCA|nr:hypothetical protein ANCCAN_03323 [Ancylostoma caninum]
MEIVAENPPCLWFMLPVVKAEFATIMRRGASYNSVLAVHSAILKGEDARLHIVTCSSLNQKISKEYLQKKRAY